jgi:hypothetical protein
MERAVLYYLQINHQFNFIGGIVGPSVNINFHNIPHETDIARASKSVPTTAIQYPHTTRGDEHASILTHKSNLHTSPVLSTSTASYKQSLCRLSKEPSLLT